MVSSFVIVGHAAEDVIIKEDNLDRFSRYNPSMSIDDVLTTHRSVQDSVPRGVLTRHLGGPVLSVGTYLAAPFAAESASPTGNGKVKVAAVTVLGTDDFSSRYADQLEKLGIGLDSVRRYEGKLPCCVYVHGPKGRQLPPFWEDNVAERFERIKLDKHFLARYGHLVLPITDPVVGRKAAEMYHTENPEGKIIYCPGPYLEDPRYDFSTSKGLRSNGFDDIMKKVHMLAMNRSEKVRIKEGLDLRSILGLFDLYSSLEVILSTKDKDGAVVITRKNAYSVPARKIKIKNPVGAGDAFLGTFCRLYYGKGYDIPDALTLARDAAEESLQIDGVENHRLLTGSDLATSPEVTVAPARRAANDE